MAIITRNVGNLEAMIVLKNGDRLGDIVYQGESVKGIGDFDGNGSDDIVLQTSYGLAILMVRRDNIALSILVPDNTQIGNWPYQNRDEVIAVGDFNGDERDDILLRSIQGIGIISRVEGFSELVSLTVAPFGSTLGSSLLNAEDRIYNNVGDFNGDGKDDLIIQNEQGIRVLSMSKIHTLYALYEYQSGDHLGNWYYSRHNVILAIGNFLFTDKSNILIKSYEP